MMKVTHGLLTFVFYYFLLLLFLPFDYWSSEREYSLIQRFPLFRFDELYEITAFLRKDCPASLSRKMVNRKLYSA